MLLRLKSQGDVRAFSIVVTAAVLLGNLALQPLFLPDSVVGDIRLSSSVIALILAGPLSFFIGSKLYAIHLLALKLEMASQRDPLTGALTRRAFHERIGGRSAQVATVILVDIDHFKRFNDHYGHAMGDVALRRAARLLRKECRSEDLVSRFGGEEFVILLPDTPADMGVKVAERLCARLRNNPLSHNGARLTVTASFGVAEMNSQAEFDAAFARADAALYRAKSAGRDRVVRR